MKAHPVGGLQPALRLDEAAERIVRVRLRELVELGDRAMRTGSTDDLHDTRIAAKRLRYVLELLGHCLGPFARDATKCAKAVQEVLGDLHDHDEMLARLDGLHELQRPVAQRREALKARFEELWVELKREGFGARLTFAAGERPVASMGDQGEGM